MVNIGIREADFTFSNFVPLALALSPSSILCWISLLIGIETKQSSAQLIIKLPEQTFQTWLDWKLESAGLGINEFRNYSFSVKQQIARGQTLRIFKKNLPSLNPDDLS